MNDSEECRFCECCGDCVVCFAEDRCWCSPDGVHADPGTPKPKTLEQASHALNVAGRRLFRVIVATAEHDLQSMKMRIIQSLGRLRTK